MKSLLDIDDFSIAG